MNLKTWIRPSLLLLFILAISACASRSYLENERLHSPIGHFKSKNTNPNPVAKIEIDDEIIHQYKVSTRGGRMPASIASSPTLHSSESSPGSSTQVLPYSTKRLYFLSLLSQYHQIKSLIGFSYKEVQTCAHFHSSMVDFRAQKSVTSSEKLSLSKQGQTHPEIKLEIKQDQELMEELRSKSKRIYREINELCQFGNTDNSYAFQNLANHFQSFRSQLNESNLSSVFKSTIYANDLILTSLKKSIDHHGRAPAAQEQSENIFLSELSQRLNLDWYYQYRDKFIEKHKGDF